MWKDVQMDTGDIQGITHVCFNVQMENMVMRIQMRGLAILQQPYQIQIFLEIQNLVHTSRFVQLLQNFTLAMIFLTNVFLNVEDILILITMEILLLVNVNHLVKIILFTLLIT